MAGNSAIGPLSLPASPLLWKAEAHLAFSDASMTLVIQLISKKA
jgi:hypothetical protein